MCIDHIGMSIANAVRAKDFFTRALSPLNIHVVQEWQGWVGFGRDGKASFWFKEGSASPPMHIAFTAQNRSQVNAFFAAALEAGARDNGPPGIRAHYHTNYFAAFVIGPDGHNLEAVCHLSE